MVDARAYDFYYPQSFPPVIPQPPALLPSAPAVSPNNGTLGYTNSAYGGVIPIVYGSDRLTGNVIWASAPLTINTTDASGQPFSYQAVDFALALCEGPINGVLRLWAGDNLILDNTATVDSDGVMQPGPTGQIGSYTIDLTDPTGPFANLSAASRQTKITIFTGAETQIAQGAMVSSDGYDATPAYRGVAYVLFENFLITQSSVPAVYVEITAHTSSQAPRLYGDFVGTTFDTWKYYLLQFDPSYNRFYTVGQKTSPAAVGIEVTDGNTLKELAQFEINNFWSIGPDYSTTCVMPGSGLLVISEAAGNAGITHVINPLSGGLLSSLGPGGNLVSHSLTDGFAVVSSSSVCSFNCPETASSSIPIDVYCAVGFVNESIGFAKVDTNGKLQMLSSLNLVTPALNNVVQPITVDSVFAAASPANAKFYDGVSALGSNVFGFSWNNNESTSIKVFRVTVFRPGGLGAAAVTIDAPVYLELAAIPVDILGGTGFAYSVRFVIIDHADNCLVLVIDAPGRGPYLAKYSPFTGRTKWVTSVPGFSASSQNINGPNWGLVTGTYAWIDANGAIWKIDLSNGTLTSASTLSAQSLPAMSNSVQYYNGAENSITYLTGTGSKHITKLFLDRKTRSTIELADIVTDLIKRTGLLPSDITVSDLAALTLHGYTISNVQAVRQCFSELGQAFTYDVAESNGKILFKTRGNGVDATILHDYIMGATNSTSADEWLTTTQLNDGSRLRKINLTYRDIDRDYANNVQSVILTKTGSQVFDPEAFIDVTVPIVLTADEAIALAEILLYAKLTYNTTYEFTLAPSYIMLDPADVLSVPMPGGEDDLVVRLRDVVINADNTVQCKASDENSDIYLDQITLFGNIGRFEKQVIPALPPRIDPFMLQIPGRSADEIGQTTSAYALFIAFLNSAVATPGGSINVTVDGTLYLVNGATFATWGYVVTPPNKTKSTAATDYDSVVTVQMIGTQGAALASAAGGIADLLASDQVNLCYIAGELFQFITATNTGGNTWQFTGLHRAKFGTDPAVGNARVGDRFVLLAGNDGVLDTTGVARLECAIGASPTKNVLVDMSTGNTFQPLYSSLITAVNLLPFRVADFEMSYVSTDVVMAWQRRDRTGDGSYPDDGSVPPSETVGQPEATESYDLYLYKNATTFVITNPTTYLRKVTVTANAFTYTAAMQTADGFVRATDTLYVLIQQTGAWDGVAGYPETEALAHA